MEQNRETEKNKYTARDRTRILLYLLSGSKRFFALGVVCSMLVSLFNLLNPRIIGYTVDYVLEDTAAGATGPL